MSIEEEITMALSQADVLAGLKEIVEEVAGVSASLIELDKNFTDDLDVDSLSMVEVVVAAEERFGVKIPDEAVTDLVTVGDAVNFIVNAAK
jgi:acyl carrier protein